MQTHQALVRELKTLRKGRGVHAGRIEHKVGRNLRATCGITDDDGPAAVRTKLAAKLAQLAEQLPTDLHQVTRAAFALDTAVRLPLYQERVDWAALKINRDPRTVRRRVDDAIEQLAELATLCRNVETGGWHTSELRMAVTLDGRRPEVLQQHRVVPDRDGLRELVFSSPFPIGRHDLDVRVLYGGTVADRDVAADHPTFTLTPANPLAAGEPFDFAVRFRLPSPQEMRPHLVHVLEHPCDLLDLHVRFGPERRPSHVSAVHDEHGVPGADHDDERQVDRAGEVHLRFRHLVPGVACGARWEISR